MKQALIELVTASFEAMYPKAHISVTARGVVVQGGVNWARSFTLHSKEGTAMVFRLDGNRDVFVSIPYRKVT